jgi:hypothetical protein
MYRHVLQFATLCKPRRCSAKAPAGTASGLSENGRSRRPKVRTDRRHLVQAARFGLAAGVTPCWQGLTTLTTLVCGSDGLNPVESVNSRSSSPKRERFRRTLRDELAHCEISGNGSRRQHRMQRAAEIAFS